MPALEALLKRCEAAHTQPLGLSIDSVYAHANWASSLEGISFPLLADFHPKGAVADAYGIYLDAAGISDRATVIIDAGGTVRHASAVGPGGVRDIGELVALCEGIDKDYSGDVEAPSAAAGLEAGAKLYVKSPCAFSRTALLARDNLHLGGALAVVNVSEDADGLAELQKAAGTEQAPCLIAGGETLLESDAIVEHLVTRSTGLWS